MHDAELQTIFTGIEIILNSGLLIPVIAAIKENILFTPNNVLVRSHEEVLLQI